MNQTQEIGQNIIMENESGGIQTGNVSVILLQSHSGRGTVLNLGRRARWRFYDNEIREKMD
jgi:hypothetical protein